MAWKHVGGVSELITTTYGRFLLVKLLLVFTLIAAGAYNQFLLIPRIARTHAAGEIAKGFALTLGYFPAIVVVETKLGISVHTARHYVKTILRKLGAHTQVQAVVIGIRAGLIDLS